MVGTSSYWRWGSAFKRLQSSCAQVCCGQQLMMTLDEKRGYCDRIFDHNERVEARVKGEGTAERAQGNEDIMAFLSDRSVVPAAPRPDRKEKEEGKAERLSETNPKSALRSKSRHERSRRKLPRQRSGPWKASS